MVKDSHKILFAIAMLIFWSSTQAQSSSFNVIDFGAAGDGTTDDSQAFAKAWQSACTGSSESEVIVPKDKTFSLKAIKFEGPCNATSISFQVLGEIIASKEIEGFPRDNWLQFLHVEGLTVDGGGTGGFDGQGPIWWKLCQGRNCPQRPTTVTFNRCNNLKLHDIKFKDSPSNFISLAGSEGVEVFNLHIQSPKDSPNTDAIDLIGATMVNIHDCVIGVGDDCIAINNHAHDVNITRVSCGPGHGISIGSLGKDSIERVHVSDCNFTGSFGGVKIKTWQGGEGFARNISYENIEFNDVQYPILIDQYYCPNRSCSLNETSAIQISDITYKSIRGTSATEAAITFNCSQNFACHNIELDDINLTSSKPGTKTESLCINAYGHVGDPVFPEVKLPQAI